MLGGIPLSHYNMKMYFYCRLGLTTNLWWTEHKYQSIWQFWENTKHFWRNAMVLQLIMVDKNLRSATGLSLSLFRWDTTKPSGVCSGNPARLIIWSGRPTTLLQLLTHAYCTVYQLGLPSTYNKVGQSNCCACHIPVCLTLCILLIICAQNILFVSLYTLCDI